MIAIARTKQHEIPLLFAFYRTAFPRSECKPFGIILRMTKEGRADLWTIRRNGPYGGLATTINGRTSSC